MPDAWVDPKGDSVQIGKTQIDALYVNYLQRLKQVLNILEVGSPSELVKSQVQNVPASPITGVWTPPKLRTIPSIRTDKEWLRQGGLEIRFDAVLQNWDESIRIILGGPGAGKTTAARYLAIQLADQYLEGKINYIPVFASMRLLTLGSTSDPLDSILSAASSFLNNSIYKDLLAEGLKGAQFVPVFILDGIDEKLRSKENDVLIASLVDDLTGRFPKARIVMTCRIFDYLHDTSSQIPAASHYLLSEFSIAQVQTTVRSWHSTAASIATLLGLPSEIYASRGESLIAFIISDNRLQEFAQTPLLLNLLQVLYQLEQSLPRSIPSICVQAINYLFIERPRLRRARSEREEENDIIDTLIKSGEFEDLCWQILRDVAQRSYDKSDESGFRIITWKDLSDSVQHAVGADNPAGFLRRGHIVHPMLEHFVAGHGVLTDINKEAFAFVHNLFQEVLAGQQFEMLSDNERINLASKPLWHLPIRAWANLAADDRFKRANAILFADHLLREWQQRTQDINLLFNAACIAGEIRQRTSGRPGEALNEELCSRIRNALLTLLSSDKTNLEHRVQIGDLLAVVGDYRIPASIPEIENIERWCVSLPSGKFRVGRPNPHSHSNPKYGEVSCCPIIETNFRQMLIGRYPVTNTEYALFIADNGYRNNEFWRTNEALLWLNNDEEFITKLRKLVEGSALKHFETELKAGRVSQKDLQELIKAMLIRQEPLYWRDARFNKANQPVVGINWWEARAYCAWLEQKLRVERPELRGVRVELPTEFEWERSGRAIDDLRPYPWGDSSPENMGIVRRSLQSLARTAAVGLFPFASWEQGPLDMIGNVWDWTRSRKNSYQSIDDVHSEDVTGLAERIVRGGSWLSREEESACLTFRSFDPPCNAYEDLGFRVAVYLEE